MSGLKVQVRMLEAERETLRERFSDAEARWHRREAELLARLDVQALENKELRSKLAAVSSETCSTHGSISELEPREEVKIPRLALSADKMDRDLMLDVTSSARISPLQAPLDKADVFAFPLSCSSCASGDSPFQSARLLVTEPPRLASAGLREVRSTTPIQIVYFSPRGGGSVDTAARDAAAPTVTVRRAVEEQNEPTLKASSTSKGLRGTRCQSSRELGTRAPRTARPLAGSQSSRELPKCAAPAAAPTAPAASSRERRPAKGKQEAPAAQASGRRSLSGRTRGGSLPPHSSGQSPGTSRSPSPTAPGLAEERAEFLHLHNRVAMECMSRPQDLPKAFQRFAEANELHKRTHGVPSSEAIYNQACCLTLGAAAASSSGDLAAGLPPLRSDPEGLVEERLDLAVVTLDAAITAGYHDTNNLLHDSDLTYLRDRRPLQFAHILSRAQDPMCKAAEPGGAAPAPSGSVARAPVSSRRSPPRAALPKRPC